VLAELHARRRRQGWHPVGRKIGFTNRTIWARYGVDRPMWSHVWDRTLVMARDGHATLPLAGLMEPRIEPEVVFRLSRPLPSGSDPVAILGAIEWIAAGFEIVHSVFPGWRFGAPDCTAAFGLHGALVAGTPHALNDANRSEIASRLPTFELTLRRGGQVIETGSGANVLGSPVHALMHLRDLLATQPQFPALAAGEIVTTGTLTDAWSVERGQTWTADYGTLGISGLTLQLA
jgi:2-oxo-3-hexenedioate decarboxylase